MEKQDYPEAIELASKDMSGQFCLYVLDVEPLIYKFGITRHIRTRLQTHYRDLNFRRVVKIYNCFNGVIMCKTEKELKKMAKINGELITKHNKTEIIETEDIEQYLSFIDNEIKKQGIIDQRADTVIYPCDIKVNDNAVDEPIIAGLKCDLCEKTFQYQSHFNRHKEKKTPCVAILDIKPEQVYDQCRCVSCNRVFSTIGNLTKHHKICKVKNGFIIDSEKRCDRCGKVVKVPNDLLRHKNRKSPCIIADVTPEHLNNPYRCVSCNKVFTNNSHLVRHIKICKVKNGQIIAPRERQLVTEIQILRNLELQREKAHIEELQQLRIAFDARIERLEQQMMAKEGQSQVINITVNK